MIAGAELFTGNNLLVMAYVSGRNSLKKVVANLTSVYLANFLGAAGLAMLVAAAGHVKMNSGSVGETAVAIAVAKSGLPFTETLLKGVLCNLLVCLSVWLAMAGRTVTDRVVAIVFPVTALFEHSIANMYFIPLGMMLGAELTVVDLLQNLIPVTLGNVLGGVVMVGLVDHTIYRRSKPT